MQLDYYDATGAYVVRVPRSEGALIQTLMRDHGLDFSEPKSTPQTACLFTFEPYAAVAFYAYATERAKYKLMALQHEVDQSWRRESNAHILCPADKELAPFQKAGVEYALRRTNCLIGDAPGLGKTMQAICLANERKARRVLVLCPANVRLQWARQIRAWTTMRWPYTVHTILHGRMGVHPTAEWSVCSYDLARSPAIGRALSEGFYDLIVLDEAHYLKTVDAGRTRAVFGDLETGHFRKWHAAQKEYEVLFEGLARRSGGVCALTGTPLPNRPREAYTLARNLCWDAIDFMSEEAFGSRFNPIERKQVTNRQGFDVWVTDERAGRHGELQARLRTNFMVRREKRGPRGVLNQLKLPIFDIVQVEETGPIKQALAAERMLDIDPESFDGADIAIMGQIAIVRHQMGMALAPQVVDYVDMLIDGGETKILVFAWHHDVLDILQTRLAKHGVIRIDGTHSAVQKQKKVDLFKEDPRYQILAGQLLSMGTGTDGLQEVANHAVIAEADWTPGNNQQGIDRLDRMGQKNTVLVDFLVAPNSFSERLLASSLRKNVTTHKALDQVL